MRSRTMMFATLAAALALPVPATSSAAATPLETQASTATAGDGSAQVGTARYAVPDGAVFVAPWGHDSSSGDADNPFRSVAHAVRRVRPGGTVVVRGGNYHETVTTPYMRPMTIQAYPGEAVWFDGARQVDGWVRDGEAWRVDGWNVNLDSSPTYFRGAADRAEQYWSFLNGAHPMAAHPDQVWIGGRELKQVGSRAEVAPGRFYVDRAAQRLYVGDNPDNATVEASDLGRAFALQSPDITLRGVGVRRYAPSVPDQGAVNTYQPRVTLENLVVDGSSTAGVGLYGADCVLRHVTVRNSGQLGISGSGTNNLVLDDLVVSGNNKEGFNMAPAAGAIKLTTAHGITLRNSLIEKNQGDGFWVDESVTDVTATDNVIRDNEGNGVHYEFADRGVIERNTITGSGLHGVSIQNAGNIRIRDNYVMSRTEGLNIIQDGRSPQDQGVSGQVRNLDIQHNTLGTDGTWIGRDKAIVRIDGSGLLDARAGSAHNIVLNNNRYAWVNARPQWMLFYSISASGDRFAEAADVTTIQRILGQEAQGGMIGAQ